MTRVTRVTAAGGETASHHGARHVITVARGRKTVSHRLRLVVVMVMLMLMVMVLIRQNQIPRFARESTKSMPSPRKSMQIPTRSMQIGGN